MAKATEEQLNNPLHGVKQKDILEYLVEHLGWEKMAEETNLNCFKNRPTIKSSLRFIRKTEWARIKVQNLYLDSLEPVLHPSVNKLWQEFIDSNPNYAEKDFDDSFHLGQSDKEAKEILKSIDLGNKTANLVNLSWFESQAEELPYEGQLNILCNWYDHAQMIIESVALEKTTFEKLQDSDGQKLGLADNPAWKEKLWESLKEELDEIGIEAKPDLPLLIEHFKVLYRA